MLNRIFATVAVVAALAAGSAAAGTLDPAVVNAAEFNGETPTDGQSPIVVKLQVLLDRAGVSPGVIDGYWGENVRNALLAFEELQGVPGDGELDAEVWSRLSGRDAAPILADYTVTEEDASGPFVDEVPEDYGQMAEMEHLGYTSVGEMLAERFHMDIELFETLNGNLHPAAGATVVVAQPGEKSTSRIARIEVSKTDWRVRGLDDAGNLVAHYPATVGSESLPSPSGTHEVKAIAPDPNYTYDPEKNFKQGDNDEKLIIPPGPNGPVGSMWIDLTKPTYGIHGTADPASVGKSASHGCVRLTNWDAEELAGRVEQGVPVVFVD